MDKSLLFGLTAGLIAVIAYGFYFKQILKSQSNPNPSSWGIWLLAGIINAFTYFSVTDRNFWQSLIVIVVLLATFIIFLYALWKGKFSKVSSIEIAVFAFAILIAVFWQITSNYRTSNVLLQIIYLISYIPTIIGILKGRAKENATSWSIILVGYIFSTLSIIFGQHTDWVAFLNPIVNGLIGTGLVVASINYKNNQRSW